MPEVSIQYRNISIFEAERRTVLYGAQLVYWLDRDCFMHNVHLAIGYWGRGDVHRGNRAGTSDVDYQTVKQLSVTVNCHDH